MAPRRAADDNWLELAGFEFPEAARQWGTIAVSVVGDWQVLWGASRGVRQIDPLPEASGRKDVTAAFEYFAQPSSLMARLVPRKTRIGVEPEYVVLVDSDQVRLEARLRYTVRGAKVLAVAIAMPDWQIDEVGPESVVAVDGVPTGAAGPLLSLPLASPTIGQFEVRLKAHRPLPAEAKSFSVALPQPQASAPAAAVVAVLPADNVEILPDSQATTGLLRQQAAVPLDLPARQQEPLFYRSDAPKAVFAAELHRHRQKITAGVASRVTLEPGGGRVEQKFAYSIAYEPTDYFLLEVPRELGGKGRLVLSYEDQVLAPVVLGEEADDGVKPLRMRVALPKACIGPCEITARYVIAVRWPMRAANGTVRVPLVMPLDAELTGNNVSVTAGAEQQVEVAPGVWTAVEGGLGQATSPRTRDFAAARRTAEIVLKLHGESGGDAAVVVERAWIQTCVTKSATAARQDRAVLQFTTRRHELEITLPEGAARDQASVQLNGGPVIPRPARRPRAGHPLVCGQRCRRTGCPRTASRRTTCSACNIIFPDRVRGKERCNSSFPAWATTPGSAVPIGNFSCRPRNTWSCRHANGLGNSRGAGTTSTSAGNPCSVKRTWRPGSVCGIRRHAGAGRHEQLSFQLPGPDRTLRDRHRGAFDDRLRRRPAWPCWPGCC